jgi:hypothetical protein
MLTLVPRKRNPCLMSIESASDARQNKTEHSPRSQALYTLLSGFVIAYGDMLHAEEPATKTTPTVVRVQETTDAIEDLKRTLQTRTPQLNDPNYFVREDTQLIIRTAIRRALDQRNPLPTDIRPYMTSPHEVDGSVEIFKRLDGLKEFLRTMEDDLPGRIAAPTKSTSLHTLLKHQFHCDISAIDPTLQKKLENYRTGTDGELSATAFQRLCGEIHALPVLEPQGFSLRSMQEGESFLMRESVGVVKKKVGEGFSRDVFLIPDKGTILSVLHRSEEEKEFDAQLIFLDQIPGEDDSIPTRIANTVPLSWTTGEGQSTPHMKTEIPLFQKHTLALIAQVPEVFQLAEHKIIDAGLQTFYMKTPEKQLYETWTTDVQGTMWKDVEWPKTTNEQDMYSYQLVATNQIEARDAAGKKLEVRISGLNFCHRDFSFTVSTKVRPSTLNVRAFTEIQTERIKLP